MAFIPLIIAAVSAVAQNRAKAKNSDDYFKTTSTVNADNAESLMKQNVAEWLAIPAQYKTVEIQQHYLARFNELWDGFIHAMADLGERGQNAVHERERGGKNSWGPDWFQLYLDPIANSSVLDQVTGNVYKTSINTTTNVVGAEVVSGGIPTNNIVPTEMVNLGSGITQSLSNPLVLAGLAFVAYWAFKGKR